MVPAAIGPLVILLAVAGLWLLRQEGTWRERLLALWILVPVAFFQLWPTKGFQYLLPIAVPVAILAGRALCRWPAEGFSLLGRRFSRQAWQGGATLVVALSLLGPTLTRITPFQSDTFLAGSGGVPGGREAGIWIRDHVPEGATLITVGPSMANIIKFYGHRPAYGLSVSPNPLHRNPSYEPVNNPDFLIRTGEVQYLVWDSFSAARSSFFSEKLLYYVQKYHGRVAHSETVTVNTPDGSTAVKPVIIIYEVRP